MTERTLEEIEALAAEATPGPWGFFKHDCKDLPSIDSFEVTFRDKYATAWIQSSNTHGVTMDRDMSRKEVAANAALLASARDLLAIAQGQREREKLIVEAAISVIRRERRMRLEDSECGGPEINDSCARAEIQFRETVSGIGTKK